MEKLRMESADILDEKIRKIAELFPDVVTEAVSSGGRYKHLIDFDALKQELSDVIVEGNDERYQFTWPDKKKARLLANSQVKATLRPCVEESVDFDTTQNLYIEGDNLDVLKLLRETYLGKVKMIYIDPPYNTGNDFLYNDKFAMSAKDYNAISGEYDEQGNRLLANTKSNGQYHTDWLNMMYSRMRVAKDFLSEDGTIFISIDDNEQANLKKLCDEVLGESNFVGTLIHQRAKGGGQAKHIVKGHDYIHIYSKNINHVRLARKKVVQGKTVEINGELYIKNDDVIRKVFGKKDKTLGDRRCFYEEIERYKGAEKKKEIDEAIKRGELFLEKNKEGYHVVCQYVKVDDAQSKLYSIIKVLSEEGKKDLENLDLIGFSYPKPTELVKQLVEAATSKGDETIMDFFSGSATTADAVMQLNAEDGGNRKFIMVQLPEVCGEDSEAYKAGYKTICEIGEERIRRAGNKIKEESGLLAQNIDTGFRVLKLDSSNMKDVYYNPDQTSQQSIEDMLNNVKEDRTPMDLLFQVMLETPVLLSSKIDERVIEGKKVFVVNDNDLICCFDDNIGDDVVKAIAQMKPLYAFFRDSSFKSDDTMVNAEQYFKTYAPDTQYRII